MFIGAVNICYKFLDCAPVLEIALVRLLKMSNAILEKESSFIPHKYIAEIFTGEIILLQTLIFMVFVFVNKVEVTIILLSI